MIDILEYDDHSREESMQYRTIKKEESKQSAQVSSIAFVHDITPSLEHIDKGRYIEDAHHGAFTDEGQMVAQIACWPLEMNFDGHVAQCGGIGGVATLPEYRRGGHIRKLFENIFDQMIRDGYTFSFLYPFSHDYYRKFGYEVCVAQQKIQVELDSLGRFPYTGHAELFINGEEGTDPEDIIQIYNTHARKMNMMLDRDAWWWERKLEHDPYVSLTRTYTWYNDAGEAKAYCTIWYDKNDINTIHVRDWAWTDREGLYGLMGFWGRFVGSAKYIKMTMPAILNPELIFPNAYKIETKLEHNGMARLVNVEKALNMMHKPALNATVTIAVEDAFCAFNHTTYQLKMQDGNCTVTKGVDGPADMTCSVHALAQMVTGYMSMDMAALRTDVNVINQYEIFQQLFTHKHTSIADYF